MTPSARTTSWIKRLAAVDMMAIEAIVASVYEQRCESMEGYALFDGGAHRGYHTLRMGALVGCDIVYAIEADPTMISDLRNILKKHLKDKPVLKARDGVPPVYRLVTKALQRDPQVENVTWKSSTSHIGRSSIASATGEGETIWGDNPKIIYREDQVIPATTIDTILADEQRPVPFIKLDLEGADLVSLMGAEATLRKKRPIVAFENSVHAPKVHGFKLDDFIRYLEDIDYVAVDFFGQPLLRHNWFGFFEAWLAPAEQVEWLAEALNKAVQVHADKVPGFEVDVIEALDGDAGAEAYDEEELDIRIESEALLAVKVEEEPLVLEEDLIDRIRRNLSKRPRRGVSEADPEETRTFGWHEMSADIARALWFHPSRLSQAVETPSIGDSWVEMGDLYTARVRAVLKFLIKEGLSFRQLHGLPESFKKNEPWMLASGRLAWLLWLDRQRLAYGRDDDAEKELWENEASDYREYVRDCLCVLGNSGIVFSE